jgi:adenylosuccinate synthase
MVNGATGLNVTLLDVLEGLPELKICTEYTLDGKPTARFIPDGSELARAQPIYRTLPGFHGDISHIRRRADLPDNARRYLDAIEEHVGVPVRLVGVGPGREQTILE